MAGRYAPSPTGDLHLGNLRTALVAWLMARTSERAFLLRIEDLDAQRVFAAGDVATRQMADLASLGIDFDPPTTWQSRNRDRYRRAIDQLGDDVYPCFCTRREIAEAASAPHDGVRAYPGTCRELSAAQRRERAATRPPALRVRAHGAVMAITDVWAGEVTGTVDDFVLTRNDGVPAYNLAVVVDDLADGVDQVVRGDDLLGSAPRQAWLTERLGGKPPTYGHVPLVVNAAGHRLAKRDGAVTLADLQAQGISPTEVLTALARSLGLADPTEQVTAATLRQRFDPAGLPREPWVFSPDRW